MVQLQSVILSSNMARRSFTIKEKAEIISKLKNGGNNADLCREYKVSHSTISTMWKNRDKILECFESKSSKFKRNRKPTHQDVDNALLKWFKAQRSQNVRLSGRLLKEKANHFARLLGKMDFKCSESWIHRFRRRHDIVVRKVSEEAGSVSQTDCDNGLKTVVPKLTEDCDNGLKTVAPKLTEDYTDSQIRNADETDEDEFFEHRLKNEFTEPFEDRLMSDQNDNIDNAIQEPFGQPDGITCETKVEDIIDHFEVDEGLFSWQRTNKDVPCDTDTLYEEAAGSETEDAVWDVKREEYSCNECSGSIVGFRYTCVQCADCDICGSCEARGAHPLHYLLRVPWHRPHAEVQDVLHRIRRELLADTIGSIPPSTNVQVKEKPPCDFELLERDPLDVKQEPKSPEPTEVVTDTVRVLPIDPAKIFTNPMRTSTEPVRLFADPKETLTDPARISTEAMRIPMESVGIFSNSNIVKAVEILKPEPEPKLRLTEPTHIASEPPQKMKCIAFSPSNVSLQRSDAANQNTFVPQQIDIKRRIQKITLPLSIKKQKVTLENTERNKPKLVVERLIKPIDEVGRRIINKRPRIEDSHPLRKIAIRPVRTRHAGDTIEYRGCLWQRLTRP